jgi:hypothetical protein
MSWSEARDISADALDTLVAAVDTIATDVVPAIPNQPDLPDFLIRMREAHAALRTRQAAFLTEGSEARIAQDELDLAEITVRNAYASMRARVIVGVRQGEGRAAHEGFLDNFRPVNKIRQETLSSSVRAALSTLQPVVDQFANLGLSATTLDTLSRDLATFETALTRRAVERSEAHDATTARNTAQRDLARHLVRLIDRLLLDADPSTIGKLASLEAQFFPRRAPEVVEEG